MRKLIILVVLASGCATAPVQREIRRDWDYGSDFDAVWAAVIDVFGEIQVPIDNIEKDSGLITTDWVGFPYGEGYADCGTPGLNTESDFAGRFNVVAREIEDGTHLTINTLFRINRTYMSATTEVRCYSSGLLEEEIAASVADRLR